MAVIMTFTIDSIVNEINTELFAITHRDNSRVLMTLMVSYFKHQAELNSAWYPYKCLKIGREVLRSELLLDKLIRETSSVFGEQESQIGDCLYEIITTHGYINQVMGVLLKQVELKPWMMLSVVYDPKLEEVVISEEDDYRLVEWLAYATEEVESLMTEDASPKDALLYNRLRDCLNHPSASTLNKGYVKWE